MSDKLIPLYDAESDICDLEKVIVLFRLPRRTLVKPYPYKRALKDDATVFNLYLRLVSWLKSQEHLYGTKIYPRIINATSIRELVEVMTMKGNPVLTKTTLESARNEK